MVLTVLGLPPARGTGGGQDVLYAVPIVGVRQPRVAPAAFHAPLEEKGQVEVTVPAQPGGKTPLQTPRRGAQMQRGLTEERTASVKFVY